MANYKLTIGAAGLSTLPDWLVGISVNQWVELDNTRIISTPGIDGGTSTSGKQDAWVGYVVNPLAGKIYSPGQGGHADYHGNEFDELDLNADAPAWTQILASSSESAVTASPAYSAYYSDGRPSSVHGYYTGEYIPSLNRVMRFWGGSSSDSGNPMQEFTAFNLNTNQWDAQSVWSSMTLPVGVSVSANAYAYALHPDTEEVFMWLYNNKVVKWTPGLPGSLSTVIASPSNPAVGATAAAIDPSRGDGGTMFMLGGGAVVDGNLQVVCHALDIATATRRAITLTGTDISSSATGCGMFWCPTLDMYIVRIRETSGGGAVYGITPTTGSSWACAALSTTDGSSIAATNDALGGDAPFTKFLYVPTLGVAVYAPRFSSNLWALKLHEVA